MPAPIPPVLRRVDPLAGLASAIVAVLATMGVLAELGLDDEQALAAVFGLFTIAASVRAVFVMRSEARVQAAIEAARAEGYAAGVQHGRAVDEDTVD